MRERAGASALLSALASRDGRMAGTAGHCSNLSYLIFLSGGATSLSLHLNASRSELCSISMGWESEVSKNNLSLPCFCSRRALPKALICSFPLLGLFPF